MRVVGGKNHYGVNLIVHLFEHHAKVIKEWSSSRHEFICDSVTASRNWQCGWPHCLRLLGLWVSCGRRRMIFGRWWAENFLENRFQLVGPNLVGLLGEMQTVL